MSTSETDAIARSPDLRLDVIAIDGPAASGKSSVARALAARLGRRHINSGLMYRAVTRALLDAGVPLDDSTAIENWLDSAQIACRMQDSGGLEILIDGRTVRELTADEVNAGVSRVARVPRVRERLVALQRELGSGASCVMEGRDIGSVVFPDARHKFYIDASEEVRRRRRAAQGLEDSIGERDREDSTRTSSPLTVPEGAQVIDTSDLTIEQVVERILQTMGRRGGQRPKRRRMRPIYRFFHTLARMLAGFLFSYRVVGREKLIEDGPALIACNHASFLDPPMVGIAFRNEIHFLARKTLFRGFFGWLYPRLNSIPVDQERADFTSLKAIIRLLKEGERVLIFPEGQRSWDGVLGEPQPGVGLVIAKARVPVIPVRLFGTEDALPRGRRWPHVVDVTLVVGDPIEFSEAERTARTKDEYRAISARVMQAVASIPPPPIHHHPA